MQYDKNRFKILAFPHALVLFWVLNPFTILNELLVGQRLPKVMLIDKESDKPRRERTYYPCPHCETLNDARLWTEENVLGNWYGLVCPSCHQIIPCLWSILSLVVLAITFPLRYFPARFFRRRWLEKEKERLAKVLERPLIEAKSVHWLLIGTFGWGGFMWVICEVIPQVREVLNGGEWDLMMMFVGLSIWLVAGFAWGLWVRASMNRKVVRQVRKPRLLRLWTHAWMNEKDEKAE